jgi:hypothetical protein
MANAIRFNTIGSTFQDELRGGFALHALDQEDERYVLLHLAHEVQQLRFLPVCAGVFGHNKVKELRMKSNRALRKSRNYI